MDTVWNIVHWQLLIIDIAVLTGVLIFLLLYGIDKISRGKKVTKDFLAVLFEMAERRELPSQRRRDAKNG